MKIIILGLIITIGNVACSGSVPLPQRRVSKVTSVNRFEVSLPQSACQSGDPVYSIQDQLVDWTSYKTDENVPVIGNIKAAGWFKIGEQSDMQIQFHPATLDSEDKLRDDRIKSIILGFAENKSLSFFVSNKDDISTAIANLEDSIEIDITGDLEIYGDWIASTIPVVISKTTDGISVRNRGLTQIDLRSSSFLTQKIVELLDVADVESMKDTVDLTFDFAFKEEC